MNNKFKRAISSILAFVMVISVLTVMNVSTAFAADVTFYGTLSADDCDTGDATAEITVSGNSYFSIMASSSAKVSIDTSSKTFTTADGTERTVINRIKTGGAGTISGRSIKVMPTSDGKVYAYATSSNTSDTRTLNLLDSEGSVVDSSATVEPSVITEVSFEVEADKTYYLASNSGGINFYYFGLTSEETAVTTYVDVTISGAPEGYVVGQGTAVIDAASTDTYSLAVGESYTVWANGYTSYSFTVESTTTTVDASSMTATNVYFDSFSNGTDGDVEGMSYTYNYTDDIWSLIDTETDNTADLYFGLNNAADLTKATISGSFAPSTANNSWTLLNFKVSDGDGENKTFGIRTVKDNGYALYFDSSTNDNTGLMHEAGTYVDYVLVIDFEVGTATLTLDNSYTATISIGTDYSQVDSIYGHTASGARNVYMTTPTAEFTYIEYEYVFFGVSEADATNTEYSSFYITNDGAKIEGSEGDTVYAGVEIDGTQTDASELTLIGTSGSDYVVGYRVLEGKDTSGLDIAFE